ASSSTRVFRCGAWWCSWAGPSARSTAAGACGARCSSACWRWSSSWPRPRCSSPDLGSGHLRGARLELGSCPRLDLRGEPDAEPEHADADDGEAEVVEAILERRPGVQHELRVEDGADVPARADDPGDGAERARVDEGHHREGRAL